VDLEARRGEIVSILGGSGSGKTTILRALIGLLEPRAGTVRLFGQDPYALDDDARTDLLARIGMSFQAGALFGSMTVGENVALPVVAHRGSKVPDPLLRRLVDLKLGQVGLADAAMKMPAELSGGMRKRAALARALVLDPEVLFFDEPTTGLDPITAASFDRVILDIRQAFGTTIVIVTHDLDTAFGVSDRLYLLGDGGVRAEGSPADLKRSRDPHVRRFLDRRPATAQEGATADAGAGWSAQGTRPTARSGDASAERSRQSPTREQGRNSAREGGMHDSLFSTSDPGAS
jgi:phospholipid/cholesterol/gamma-HCH transport system ATP-binding protein